MLFMLYVCLRARASYLFGGQGPRWLVLFFAEVRVLHVGSCRGGSACAQLVLVLVLMLVLVLELVLVLVLMLVLV